MSRVDDASSWVVSRVNWFTSGFRCESDSCMKDFSHLCFWRDSDESVNQSLKKIKWFEYIRWIRSIDSEFRSVRLIRWAMFMVSHIFRNRLIDMSVQASRWCDSLGLRLIILNKLALLVFTFFFKNVSASKFLEFYISGLFLALLAVTLTKWHCFYELLVQFADAFKSSRAWTHSEWLNFTTLLHVFMIHVAALTFHLKLLFHKQPGSFERRRVWTGSLYFNKVVCDAFLSLWRIKLVPKRNKREMYLCKWVPCGEQDLSQRELKLI